MANFVDVANESVAVAVDAATLSAAMAAVPVPDYIAALGLRVTADANVIVGNNVTRTVQLAFGPSATATATLTLKADGSIESVNMVLRGLDYIVPPIVTVNPGANPLLPLHTAQLQAFLRVNSAVVDAGGAGYPAPPATSVRFIGGLPPADTRIVSGCVRQLAITRPGLGYAAGTVAVIEGGGPGGSTPLRQATADVVLDAFGRIVGLTLTDMGAGYISTPVVNFVPPGGVPPTKLAKAAVSMAEGTPALAHATVLAGVVTGVVMDDPGAGYIGVPAVVIAGVGGAGALAHARMEVERVDIRSPGLGYAATALPVFTPFFKAAFPDTSNQAAPFFGFMEALLRERVITPILPHTPVLS